MSTVDGETATLTRPEATPDAAIRVRDLVLDYPLGPLVRGSLKSAVFSMFSRRQDEAAPQTIRALDGVSFDVRYREHIGVIGRNGSGKSTLLRALAGIYPATSGEIHLNGRVQGLFDITFGFESEATGRENILYRGLVMGLSPAQIREREAEIVAFADIGEFIDYPTRTYSSGMSVRLAFAISTFLNGDILLFDEMLAAGDAAFQERVAVRMNSLVEGAGVIVLVSHDMATVKRVCPRTIWLRKGRIVADGPSEEVCDRYIAESVADG